MASDQQSQNTKDTHAYRVGMKLIISVGINIAKCQFHLTCEPCVPALLLQQIMGTCDLQEQTGNQFGFTHAVLKNGFVFCSLLCY